MHALIEADDDSFHRAEPLRKLLVIIGLALGLRILWAVLVPVMPESDSLAYDTFARNLVDHGVFGWSKEEPFSFWAPGAAFIYAAAYRLAGFDYLNVVVVNLAASVALIVFTARVAARFYGVRVALWSAAVLAVWPTLVMFTTLLTSELHFLMFTMAALDAWTARRGGIVARGLAAGALVGAATLVRPMALLLPFVYAAAMVLRAGWQREEILTQSKMVLLALAALACVLAPWTWRNYQLYGHLVLVSTNGGVTLWMGNVPGGDGFMVYFPEHVKGLNDYERDQVLGALGRKYIAEDPLGFVWRTLRKLVLLFSNESIGALWNSGGIRQRFGADAILWFKRLTQVSWALIFLLAVAGAAVLARKVGVRRALASPFGLLVAYFSVVHSVSLIADRYHLVMAPYIAVMAGGAIASGVRRRENRAPPALAATPGHRG